MIVKHLVDRYLIYYVYSPTKINSLIHSTAVIFFHIALYFLHIEVHSFLVNETTESLLIKIVIIIFSLSLIYRFCIKYYQEFNGDK